MKQLSLEEILSGKIIKLLENDFIVSKNEIIRGAYFRKPDDSEAKYC